VPPKKIEKLGWDEGASLLSEIKNQRLIIRKETQKKRKYKERQHKKFDRKD